MTDPDETADSQDMAEIFDETNSSDDGADIAHPDIAPDEYDVTQAEDDADEDQPSDVDDFDPDDVDEADLEIMLEADDGVDQTRHLRPDAADAVSGDDLAPAAFEGPSPKPKETTDRSAREARLDADLESSFPASDPISPSPGAT
jgi:hypothetical protein